HTTGEGVGNVHHCIDGLDVMCYRDDGPLAFEYSAKYCSVVHFDCNHDDYFNPAPIKGTYLAIHWNIGSPLNRFVAGCTYATGVLDASAGDAEGSSLLATRDPLKNV